MRNRDIRFGCLNGTVEVMIVHGNLVAVEALHGLRKRDSGNGRSGHPLMIASQGYNKH